MSEPMMHTVLSIYLEAELLIVKRSALILSLKPLSLPKTNLHFLPQFPTRIHLTGPKHIYLPFT